MRRAAKKKNAILWISAEGYTMKERFVIRLNRKNELNAAWVFLILASLVFCLMSFLVRACYQRQMIFFGCVIILTIALIYQGFEVLKEK